MERLLDNMNLLLVFGILFQAILFSIIFLRHKKNGAVRILGLYELILFFTYAIVFFYHLKVFSIYISAYFLLYPFYALLNVFFYLFIRRVCGGQPGRKEIIHFTFPLLLLIANVVLTQSTDFNAKYSILVEKQVLDYGNTIQQWFFTLTTKVYPLLLIFMTFLYVILNAREVWILKKKIRKEFSYGEGINLSWAHEILVAFTILFIISLFLDDVTYTYAMVLFTVILVGVNSVNYIHRHYNAMLKSQLGLVFDDNNKVRYAHSSLSTKEKDNLYNDVVNCITRDKMFLSSDLRLTDIATRLKTNRQYVSQVINESSGENFYHFINKFRIEEFIRQYKNSLFMNHSIEGMANSVGFKSKSSFYSAFKKHVGITPSEFIRQNPLNRLSSDNRPAFLKN